MCLNLFLQLLVVGLASRDWVLLCFCVLSLVCVCVGLAMCDYCVLGAVAACMYV